MYVNKCIKCGREFETKNPKRVICPDCLYPDKKMMVTADDSGSAQSNLSSGTEQLSSYSTEERPQHYNSYSSGGDDNQRPYRPQRNYNNNNNRGYGQNRQNNRYNNNRNNNNNRNGYNNNRYNNNNNSRGGFQQRRPQNNRFNNNRRPNPKRSAPKQLLVSKEQLEQIELLYKLMLPLPNPEAHEIIGEKIGLEPRKVFFGINLVRQKMMLPKLPYPKRRLAITPDQLNAIKMLYEPLLPLPPIGCHKIIASQLKMDEWRVHVGIGLVRAQMGLERWNQDRPDAPEEFKNQNKSVEVSVEKTEEATAEEPVKKKRGRKPKAEQEAKSEE